MLVNISAFYSLGR